MVRLNGGLIWLLVHPSVLVVIEIGSPIVVQSYSILGESKYSTFS